jgi:CRISPR-associated protein Cas4
MGLEVASEAYKIMGKIDVYDRRERALIERKTKIKQVYDGHRFQLYAQYFCLTEMGYPVESLFIHSLEDNKRYPIPLPGESERKAFEETVARIRSFSMDEMRNHSCPKCAQSIYGALAW